MTCFDSGVMRDDWMFGASSLDSFICPVRGGSRSCPRHRTDQKLSFLEETVDFFFSFLFLSHSVYNLIFSS